MKNLVGTMIAAGALLAMGACAGGGKARPGAAPAAAQPEQGRTAAPEAARLGDANKPKAEDTVLASNADRPTVGEAPARSSVESFRPGWWLAEPQTIEGVARVCGMGESAERTEARGLAIADATQSLSALLGHSPRDTETERYTVVQLSSGAYRAFVLMSGKD